MIVTIGGGSGMPIVNQALVKAGFSDIHSIVTTFDSGGDSGRIRTDERGSVLAFSDYWRSILSLWNDGEQKKYWQEMLKYRDGRGRNFGNLFFQFMAEKSGDLSKVDSLFSLLTGAQICGQVVPVATSPADVCFETMSGKKFIGEHHLDDQRMSLDKVNKLWLSADVEANCEAINSINRADLIIICPGSLYGSVLINFLPIGMKSALEKTRARKLLITNIMSVSNETDGFDQDAYVKVINKYAKIDFDMILMPDLSFLKNNILNKVYKSYFDERSQVIKFNLNGINKVVLADIVHVDELNLRLRHSEDKLAKFFAKMEYVTKKN